MLNAIYLKYIVLICIVNLFGKTANTKNKIAFNNCLRRLLTLPKPNSESEMFVN